MSESGQQSSRIQAQYSARTALSSARKASARSKGVSGFTLIELMIAISIMAIMLAVGVPNIIRAMEKDTLRKAVRDLVEGCSHARALAILQGVPAEFIIRENGQLSVRKVPLASPDGESPLVESGMQSGNSPSKLFSATLDDDVAVELIYVNFIDKMGEPEARVRFFPNGTSDEFTVILSSVQGSYKVSLDLVTGLARSEKLK
jgi:prepilin-type N-terminal cleavage/methylation domain-containing protein